MIDPGFSDWPWQPLKAYSGPDNPNPRHTSAFVEVTRARIRLHQGIGPLPNPVPRETEDVSYEEWLAHNTWSSGCGGTKWSDLP